MDFKIINKRVGQVEIFEFFGNLTGLFARQAQNPIAAILGGKKTHSILYIIPESTQIDAAGAEVLIEGASKVRKSALLAGQEILSLIDHLNLPNNVKLLSDKTKAAFFLEKELVAPDKSEANERRQHDRLDTALPLRILCDLEPEKLDLFAIVTNLSEGGLHAQFIESESERNMKAKINPLDLRMLNLVLYIHQEQAVKIKGKVVHGNMNAGHLGVEFYEIPNLDKQVLQDWISNWRKSQKDCASRS